MTSKQADLTKLTPAEKLQLVEYLWDDLAADPYAIPIQDWQLEEVERRKANLAADPESAVKWEAIVWRVRERLP